VRCGNLLLDTPNNTVPVGQPVTIAIRPEEIRVDADSLQAHMPNVVEAEVMDIEFLGVGYRLELSLAGNARQTVALEISANRARSMDINSLKTFSIQLPPEMIRVFPKES
jgi:ABC-type Fe3+/spermidine/putrescine transport system ATPase subunit